jgi:molecular chaperone DnaK (HSP70)
MIGNVSTLIVFDYPTDYGFIKLMPIAIDFGTSNTVIARWNSATDAVEVVNLKEISQQLASNPPLIPSLVYVEDATAGQIILGQKVRDRGLDLSNNPRFFRSFKRGIGNPIQGFMPELDETTVTFENVGKWYLDSLVDRLKNTVPDSLDSLILTVPVDSFEAYRLWLGELCQSWEISQVQMLDEPTAAALGYGKTGKELLLVIDFGGGTIDLSLVQLSQKNNSQPQGFFLKWGDRLDRNRSIQQTRTARVIAKAGQNLGGSDIDNWLVDYFVEQQGLNKSSLVTRLAEKLKIQLSSQDSASEAYFNDETLESYELELDRDTLTSILRQQDFFNQLDELMAQVLQQARRNGIEKDEIEAVLLVGGTVRVPAIQTWVKQYFPEDKIECDRPFDAIATGALQLAQGYEIRDFLYHSYGIRYWNRRENCHGWHPIIKSGQPYPMSQPVELTLGASVENQPKIELIIGELGAETTSTEVYFDGDRLLTRNLSNGETSVIPLNDSESARTIAQLNPAGFPGRDRVKLQFSVDERRLLRLTVEDLLTLDTLLEDKVVATLS